MASTKGSEVSILSYPTWHFPEEVTVDKNKTPDETGVCRKSEVGRSVVNGYSTFSAHGFKRSPNYSGYFMKRILRHVVDAQ
jgi:hypothetical protein